MSFVKKLRRDREQISEEDKNAVELFYADILKKVEYHNNRFQNSFEYTIPPVLIKQPVYNHKVVISQILDLLTLDGFEYSIEYSKIKISW